MSNQKNHPSDATPHGNYRSYVAGFVMSLALTVISFAVVMNHMLGGWQLILMLVSFAILQLLVQLIFFLHMGRGSGRAWNALVFGFMLIVVVIVVAGSIWIMNNLDYNMMPHEMNDYMIEQSKKGF